jgi:mono/diheme cytochrome c family protein/uncharacterized cupredoxin-like copper-binding protein
VNIFGRHGVWQLRGAIVLAICVAVALPMAASTATSATVKVTVGKPREMAFTITPTKVSAGTVTFQVTNAGKLPHVFQVCSSPLGGGAVKCAGPKTATIEPGKTVKLVAKLGIGKHEYLDPVTGHTAAKGTLVVIAAAPTAGGGTPSTTPASGGGTSTTSGGTTTTTAAGGASGNLVGDPAAGATVFATAGCTTCHTLKAAGSTGGIDLDALAPDQATAIDNVSNGNAGGMPNFSQQLTKAQIDNVAAYVFCVTHGHTPQNC